MNAFQEKTEISLNVRTSNPDFTKH